MEVIKKIAIATCALGAVTVTAAEKPNVLIIVADDMGWGDVGYHGSKIQTPNIDRFAETGIELNRFYVSPVSTPTRAGILTGRYPSRFGIRKVVIPPWRKDGLDATERTMADMSADNGYANRAMIGKWHLGHTYKEHYPLSRGFNHFYGCLNGAIDYFTHEREGELDWHRGWDSSYDKGYVTDLVTKEAKDCINNYSKDKSPFFLYVAYTAPHSPFQAPQEEINKLISEEKFAALPQKAKNEYIYEAMVRIMDKGIGEIFDTLKANDQWDNTIILFMSDNGAVSSIPKASTSKPLRGGKFTEWDGGVRVPAIIYWNKGFDNGHKSEQLTAFVDIMPTIAEIVGDKTPKKPYDGVNMLSVFEDRTKSIDRDIYLGCGAVVTKGWKYIKAGSNPKMKLEEDYLVSYKETPFERENVATKYPKVVERLEKIAIKYDTITPSVKEVSYEFGRKGFIAPKEWRMK